MSLFWLNPKVLCTYVTDRFMLIILIYNDKL